MDASWARDTSSLVAISPVAVRVIQVLGEFTAFPHALLGAVCERSGRDLGALDYDDMPALIQALALQVAVFNDVEAGFAVKRRLLLALYGRRDEP